MARSQFKVTFTNAQPGAPVEILTPSTEHVYPSLASTSPVGGKQLYLDATNSVTVWSDAQAVIAQTVDGTGSFIQGTATVASPTVTIGDGTAPTNPAVSAASGPSGGAAWLTATPYQAGAIVVQAGVNYECTILHTSGTFATDLAAGKWIETGVNSGSAVTLSNATPSAPGRAGSSGSSTSALRADAILPSGGIQTLLWGNAADGSATLDGATAVTGMSRSGSVYTLSGDRQYDTLTINSGVTLKTNACLLHVANTLTVNGTIQNNGSDAAGATGGAGAPQVRFGGGGTGGNGGTGVGGTGGNPSGANSNFFSAGGGAGASGAGGAGGSNVLQFSNSPTTLADQMAAMYGLMFVNNNGTLTRLGGGAGGGGGGGDTTNSGGGGGGGAGPVLIWARIIVIGATGAVQSKGGNGAAGVAGNSGGGGGGYGGIVVINTTSLTNNGSISAASGLGGAGVGTGVAGTNGQQPGVTQTNLWV